MLTTRPVPARRHDSTLQNFIYKGEVDPATRRKDQELVARVARRVRKAVSPSPRNGTK
jgi:hypothetical protein